MLRGRADAHAVVVTFRSGRFNTEVVKPSFINLRCFGDDLARWLIQRLHARGIAVADEPGQEDFGWYVSFRAGGVPYHLFLGHRPGDGGESVWIAFVRRRRGPIGALLSGRRRRNADREALRVIDEVLADQSVTDVRWHDRHDFDAGREEAPAARSSAD